MGFSEEGSSEPDALPTIFGHSVVETTTTTAAPPPTPVQTLVFFDLETTSLPRAGQRVGITELALVAVDRAHFEKQVKPVFRVLNKLTLCIRPEVYLEPMAAQKSGMSEALLGNQRLFREAVPSLRAFLASLPAPVCLLAHNGDYFDFPILRASDHLQKTPGVSKVYYRKFWDCLANLGVWRCPAYLEKKRNSGQLNVITKREIMSKCVLEHVRDL
ncbi:hypothetical protein HPB47_018379 [Ixodes persulcatus]|uniref:Uncharacterized protein n=1 Tax=Ixodes persulcatus TaxID=34615 RepID=A0AC60QKV6_IXOPE|nr:hypothetical protein HPB47_018379 [Ixodes persulcatus]